MFLRFNEKWTGHPLCELGNMKDCENWTVRYNVFWGGGGILF